MKIRSYVEHNTQTYLSIATTFLEKTMLTGTNKNPDFAHDVGTHFANFSEY